MNTAMNNYPGAAQQNTKATESADPKEIGHLPCDVAAQNLTTDRLRQNRRST